MFQPWSKREAALGRIEFDSFYHFFIVTYKCLPPLFAGEVNCNL